MSETERLIDRLVEQAEPVRRLRPPMVRAAFWLAPALVLGLAAILWLADMRTMEERMARPELPVELAGTFATGLLAVIAAFEISVPGHDRRWALLPFPALAVWLAGSGAGCWRDWWATDGAGGFQLGHSLACFKFILGFGVPLTATLVWALWRARPLAPARVAAMGALGAAGLAAFALQFFHPFDVTVMDLSVHAVSVAIVVGAGAFIGRAAPDAV